MNWVRSLLSSDEVAADSVVFCTILAEFALIIMSGAQMYHHPDLFSPLNFGTASAAIIGAGGGVKVFRERVGAQPNA